MTVHPNSLIIFGVLEHKMNNTSVQTQSPIKTLRNWAHAEWRGILAEFLATLILVLFGCMSCIPVVGIDTTLYGPFAFGIVVMFNVQIFGHISGAYMNPAVTLLAIIWGKTTIIVGILYIAVQCAGAVLGYRILMAVSPVDLVTTGACVTGPYPGLTTLQTLGIEIGLTGSLCLVICGVWDPVNASNQDSAAIKIGFTIIGLTFAGGALTGAGVNPARSLGPAVWTNHWSIHWVYWVGPLVGGGIAAVFYKLVFLKNFGLSRANGIANH